MAVDRTKGQFVQAATMHRIPKIDGSFLSVDGMLDFDTVYEQEDYPDAFANLGIVYNQPGDNDSTQFRTPPIEEWYTTRINTREVTFDFNVASQTSVGFLLPVGVLLRITAIVRTVWDGASATVHLGTIADPDELVVDGTIDLLDNKGSIIEIAKEITTPTQYYVEFNQDSSTQGELLLLFEYTGDDENNKWMIRF